MFPGQCHQLFPKACPSLVGSWHSGPSLQRAGAAFNFSSRFPLVFYGKSMGKVTRNIQKRWFHRVHNMAYTIYKYHKFTKCQKIWSKLWFLSMGNIQHRMGDLGHFSMKFLRDLGDLGDLGLLPQMASLIYLKMATRPWGKKNGSKDSSKDVASNVRGSLFSDPKS